MVSQLSNEQRVLFPKGEQRKFLDLVVGQLNCISVRGILQFGFDIPYCTLKNYYTQRRLLPKGFFENLCHLARIDKNQLDIKYIDPNWGQVLGGKKSRRKV
ncbi:Uncharacterised protein [uncultured archaeon]|nr:Uncharacterised protein [uncultured archaeon]